MTALFCSARLLTALSNPVTDASAPPASDNRLGAWTASLMLLRPARLLLAVSEHARLPVVLTATPYDSLLTRLPEAVYELLLELKVPVDLARLERMAMQPLQPVAGIAHGHLGQLKACGIELHAAWERGLSRSPGELSVHLAQLASEHLEGGTPAQAARRRFHLTPEIVEPLGL